LFIILQSSIMQNLRIFGYLKESILNLELRAVLKKLGDNQTARPHPSAAALRPCTGFQRVATIILAGTPGS
jgi:hypothetical protein